jgi:transposase-like protein
MKTPGQLTQYLDRAICADTKLLATFMVGGRDTDTAIAFVDDLKERLANRVQLTTDGRDHT